MSFIDLHTNVSLGHTKIVGLGGEKLWLCPTLGGDKLDISGNGNHGTYNGGMGTINLSGSGGTKAYDFDGSNDYISLSQLIDSSYSAIAFSAWVYVDLWGHNDVWIQQGTNPRAIRIGTRGQGVISDGFTVVMFGGGVNDIYSGATSVGSTGSWHHWLFQSASGGSGNLYVDGVVQSGNWTSGTSNINGTTYIGASPSGEYADVKMDDIRIFDRALTTSEIKHLASKRGVLGSPKNPVIKKRRIFYAPTAPVTTTAKAVVLKKPKPSYATGYARNASESANPNLWKGLVGAWMPSLGVTGEKLKDVSGNGNDGTLTNMDAASDWVATSKGLALDFDGGSSSNYISLGASNDIYQDLTEATWLFWLKFDSFTNYPYNQILETYAPSNNYQISCLVKSNGKLAFYLAGVGGSSFYDGTGIHTLSTGKWHQLAFVYKGGTKQDGYVDSRFDGRASGIRSSLIATTQEVLLSRSIYQGGRYIDGQYGSVIQYNRALSPSEIKQLYVDSLAPFRTKKRTVVRVPAAIPTATKVGSFKKPTTIAKPSYQAGYARNASESENPQLWDGLVSWVPALGSSGSTVRCIQDKSRGIKNNGVTFSGSSEQSLSNGAFLSFDGSNDYMRIYDSSLKNVGGVNPNECLAVRFRRRSLAGTTALFGYFSAGFLGAYGRGFYFDGTTMNCMSERNNNNAAITTTVDDNQWHVAIANFGTDGSFYLDGKLIGTGTLNYSWNYWLQLASASAHLTPPENSANAAVDVSVAYQWNRLLTASEIKKLSTDSLAPFRKKQRVSVAVPAGITFKPYWAKQSTQVSGLLK